MRVLYLLMLAGCDWLVGLEHVPPADAMLPDQPDRPLVAHWTMDSITAGVLADTSGNGHDGACVAGCPTPTAGQIGGAMAFDGTTTRVRVPGGGGLAINAAYTVTMWVRMAAAPTDYACPVSKVYGPIAGDSWQLCIITDLELDYLTQSPMNPGDEMLSQTVTLPLDQWVFIALRYDGLEKNMSLDGVDCGSKLVDPSFVDDGPVTIGADENSGQITAPFPGDIDDVQIFKRALTVAELATIQSGMAL